MTSRGTHHPRGARASRSGVRARATRSSLPRPRFVLLALLRFLLTSVSQPVKAATASGVHLMTWRVETKGSFARRQVYIAEGLDETTFLLLVLFLPLLLFSSSGFLRRPDEYYKSLFSCPATRGITRAHLPGLSRKRRS